MGKRKYSRALDERDNQTLNLLAQGWLPQAVHLETGQAMSEVYTINRTYGLWTGYMMQDPKPEKRWASRRRR